MESVEKVAEAVLYEGYLLYPYTRTALKNQMRWTFGGVYPREYSEATGGDDPWLMQTECLLTGSDQTGIEVKVLFLQVVDRMITSSESGRMELVESLRVGDRIYRPWEEAIEREQLTTLQIADLLETTQHLPIAIESSCSCEPLTDQTGTILGAIVREWKEMHGDIQISAMQLDNGLYKLKVQITNETLFAERDRVALNRRSFISTHTILRVMDGQFISLLEPPDEYAGEAKQCENIRTWPVLMGEPGQRDIILSSPIILYDYPQVSPETPGDLFDGTEIDELLRFSILTLTDEEKKEMRESDERGRAILERTEAMTPADLMSLHASVRSVQTLRRPEE